MKPKGLVIAAAVFAVLLVAILALPLLVDADAFRPRVQQELSAALGRDVQIGKLSLSVLSGGIKASDITIADDPQFSREPFLHAQSLVVGAELLPLIFSHSLRVTNLTLREPQVVLLHARSGKWNFSSLGAGAPKASANSGGSDLSVAVLKIVGARITAGQVPSQSPPSVYENVNLVAHNVSYVQPMQFTLDAKTPGGGSLKLEGTAGPINRGDAALTPLSAKLSVEHMDLGSTGFLDSDSGIAGILDYTGNVQSDGATAHSEGKASLGKLRVVRNGTPAKVPVAMQYSADYDLKKQTGVLSQGEVRTGQGITHLAGNYDARGAVSQVHLKLNGSRLPVQDVEGLLPALGVILPAGASLQGGTVDTNMALDGPLDRLVTSGTVNIANARLTGFNLASKLAAISALAGLKGSSETTIQTLSSNLRIAPDGIRADNLNLLVPEIGSMTGGGVISGDHALNFRMVAHLANGGGVLGTLTSISPMRQSGGGVPFLIQGTTSNPVFIPDVAGALTNSVPGAAAQGLGGVLGGLFGGKKKQ